MSAQVKNIDDGAEMSDRAARLKLARETAGYDSAAAAAQTFGWSEATYRSHENTFRGFKIGAAKRYADAFNVSLDWLFYNKGYMKAGIDDHANVNAPARPLPRRVQPPAAGNAVVSQQPVPPSRRKLPVYGLAQAGPEGALAFDGTITKMVPCPAMLEDVTDAYAVYVHGDSMEPRYFSGEVVFVDPARPARVGDFVVCQVTDPRGGIAGYVKRLKRQTREEIVLEQFNPHKELRFSPREVKAIGRIVFMGSE